MMLKISVIRNRIYSTYQSFSLRFLDLFFRLSGFAGQAGQESASLGRACRSWWHLCGEKHFTCITNVLLQNQRFGEEICSIAG